MDTVDETQNIYTDQTRKSPITSSRGNKYILITYIYDDNAILSSPLNIISGSHIVEAYTKQVEHLTHRWYRPRVHWLDNEASDSLKKYNKQKDIDYQLVPPHIHRVNASEQAIMKWKDHFIAGISITDTRFPTNMWCQLIPQATMKLNMMISCRRNPTMLAHTVLERQFDFSKTPLTPPGIKVIVHGKPQHHKTWGIHGVPGWCIRPVMEHCRFYICHTPNPRGGGRIDVVDFFHNTSSCRDYQQQNKPPGLPNN